MDKVNVKYSFAFKLSLYVITCVIITFLSVLIYNYYISRNAIIKNIRENAEALSVVTLAGINSVFSNVQQIAEDIPSMFEYSTSTEEDLLRLLKDIVRNCEEVFGCTICFEPSLDKKNCLFAPYFYKEKNGIGYIDLNKSKNYLQEDWYTIPKKSTIGVWSGPYLKQTDNISLVTYSQPFYKTINGKKKFSGVVACDVDLGLLEKFACELTIFETGYIFILSPKGVYITHKNKGYAKLNQNIFSLAKKTGSQKLRELGEKMIRNEKGFEEYYSHILGKDCYVFFSPLKKMGWSVGLVVPEDELFSDLNIVTFKLFIIGLLGYIFTLIMIIFLAKRMTRPLRVLANATYEVGTGDFNAKLPIISSTDEIGVLSSSFRVMQENLIKYITNLQETTAAKEKIERELSIAHEIQQNLIPHNFPCLRQIDLYATLIPAREIGGDLYDFFFIDEKHLCFAVGDVSGKGVPAALLMAVVKTLLRAKISTTTDTAQVLNSMNKDLCKDNESAMFVTFFLVVFNIETGILEYCNAGHPPPLIHTANKGFYYFNTDDTYPPLGIITDTNYVLSTLKLFPEDIFFLYTDGVTEAMNIDSVQFSEEKLLEILFTNKDETTTNIINNIKLAIEHHALDAAQSDDITMLIMKYNGQ